MDLHNRRNPHQINQLLENYLVSLVTPKTEKIREGIPSTTRWCMCNLRNPSLHLNKRKIRSQICPLHFNWLQSVLMSSFAYAYDAQNREQSVRYGYISTCPTQWVQKLRIWGSISKSWVWVWWHRYSMDMGTRAWVMDYPFSIKSYDLAKNGRFVQENNRPTPPPKEKAA